MFFHCFLKSGDIKNTAAVHKRTAEKTEDTYVLL